MSDDLDALVSHLVRRSRLTEPEARALVAEVIAAQAETLPQWLARRHAELQRAGVRNAAIFERLQQEASGRRFAAGSLTIRQIRRTIYG